MAFGHPRVVLTRAKRVGDAPAMPSRWLQRLDAVAGSDAAAQMRQRGEHVLGQLHAGDAIAGSGQRAERPEPKPVPALRPRNLSVSDVERLIRDPYAVYARKVLGLQPLPEIMGDFSARERGTLLHEALERAVQVKIDLAAPDARAKLDAILAELIAHEALPPDIITLWQPRLDFWMEAFITHEIETPVALRLPETNASRTEIADTGATLSGRADRIDIKADGTAVIIDYKTGTTPSKKQAHILLAPQLPLEAALLQRGAFSGVGEMMASDLLYLRFKANEFAAESILKIGSAKDDPGVPAPELAARAWDKLEKLIRYYDNPANGYHSRRMPARRGEAGDYDHLARAFEWMAEGEDGSEGEGE
jgi:ATP-dependent helicase/nuclease subunit B